MFFARFRPILAKVRGQKSLSPAFGVSGPGGKGLTYEPLVKKTYSES